MANFFSWVSNLFPEYGSERYQLMLEWLVLIGWCLAIIFGGTILSLYQKTIQQIK